MSVPTVSLRFLYTVLWSFSERVKNTCDLEASVVGNCLLSCSSLHANTLVQTNSNISLLAFLAKISNAIINKFAILLSTMLHLQCLL